MSSLKARWSIAVVVLLLVAAFTPGVASSIEGALSAIQGAGPAGSAVVGNPVQIGGSQAGTLRAIAVDASGRPEITQPNPLLLQSFIWGFGTNGAAQVVATCDGRAAIAAGAAATTRIITGVALKNIYVCGYQGSSAGVGTWKFVSGTGATCGTGTGDVSGAATVGVATPIGLGGGLGIVAAALVPGDSLCITTTGAATFGGILSFVIF